MKRFTFGPPSSIMADMGRKEIDSLIILGQQPLKEGEKMTYVVTENCIKCKYMDCVEVCPVDCFYEGENFLVINPDECIDCGVCEPECPASAILPDSDPRAEEWKNVAIEYSSKWPKITQKRAVAEDADEWKDKPNKTALLSPNPAGR